MDMDNDTIDVWVRGLPASDELHVVSLLGSKPSGISEFRNYPFRSSEEHGTKPTFQDWLTGRYMRHLVVHEFPTTDLRGIPSDTLARVTKKIADLLARGKTVVVVDSAGAERTSRVCEAIRYKRA
jgi:hypothetical protein